MKRTFKSLLAIVSIAFIAIGAGFSTPASATITPDTRNSVTCNRYDNGLFPQNGRYYDCTHGSAFGGYNVTAQGVINTLVTSIGYPSIRTIIQKGTGTKIWILNDGFDTDAWFAYPSSYGTLAQRQATYTKDLNSTASTLDPSQIDTCDVRIFAAKFFGTYPQEVTQGTSVFQNAVAHEVGHCFDALTQAPTSYTRISASAQFTGLAAKDLAYMQAHDANYAKDIVDDARWLNGHPDELFAEQFARTMVGPILPVDTVLIQFWGCTTIYAQTWMNYGRAPTAADFTNAGFSRCN